MENAVKDLSKYRYETGVENLTDAKIMFDNGRYKNALNRAYYSMFHAIRAVCALDGFDSSKHSGVISYFNQNYVKTEIFQKEMSKLIRYASENREKADYLDFFVASKEEAEKQIKLAEEFIDAIKKYLIEKEILAADE